MKKQNKNITHLFITAMILDFSLPKSMPLFQKHIQMNAGQKTQLAMYPLHAKTAEHEISTCELTTEKFVSSEKATEWSQKLAPENKGQLPIGKILKKIDFDFEFELHDIDKLIMNVQMDKATDSCGVNMCNMFAQLEQTLLKMGRTLRVYTANPIDCGFLPVSPILFEDESGQLTPAAAKALAALTAQGKVVAGGKGKKGKKGKKGEDAVVAGGKSSKGKKVKKGSKSQSSDGTQIAQDSNKPGSKPGTKTGGPLTTESLSQTLNSTAKPTQVTTAPNDPVKDTSTTLEIAGPPFKVIISQEGRPPITVRVPAVVPMKEGRWTIKLLSPSWLMDLREVTNEIADRAKMQINLTELLEPQLQWVQSLADEDQTIEFDPMSNRPNILVPKGGPPIPLPRTGVSYRVVRGNNENPDGT